MFALRSSTILANLRRWYSITPEEKLIYNKLTQNLQPKQLQVNDISGGCGSMFAIDITSEKFKGLSIIKQHKLAC